MTHITTIGITITMLWR